MTIRRSPSTLCRGGVRALLVGTSWMGEVLVDDPPYLLEVHLVEPAPCWCRLDLLPEAGGSTVMLTVAPWTANRHPCRGGSRPVGTNLNRL